MQTEEWQERFERDQRSWLFTQINRLTTDILTRKPSEWAESKRYLPASTTPLPGYYRFEVAPYLREILDCVGFDSHVREVTVMKGVQLGFTVGVIENAIGYLIDDIQTAPIMMVTADGDLAKARMDSYITPMLHYSGLLELIKSSDSTNKRKTGKTDKRIEWFGGGFLVPCGAQNPNALRSQSFQVMLRDEIDGWPDKCGKHGDPMKLSADRTASFEASRKIVDISTPLIEGQSKIESRFNRGDQRHYFVRCLKCNAPQILRWRHKDKPDGEVGGGIIWETDGGKLVQDSVRYECHECRHPHTNDDKVRLLSPDHGAEWLPTAEPDDPSHRSYHLSGLYSPVGMRTWGSCVQDWLEAWDPEQRRARDVKKLQVFYNNVLGVPFKLYGERLGFREVSTHRRNYHRGEVPNLLSASVSGGPILLLTCAVDVHKHNLAVAIFGWARNRRCWLISYERFEGQTERLDDEGTWGRLRKLIEDREFVADDGKKYRIAVTLIDSGYRADDVYQFASDYEAGVYPVKGRDAPPKSASLREFSEFTTPMGTRAYGVTVDFYKDRWSAALRRVWPGIGLQPEGHFNAPVDITDAELKELTVERKREKIDEQTGLNVGWEWYRPSGAPNELWDTLIYGNAALDMLAWHMCVKDPKKDAVNWTAFYDRCEANQLFFSE